MLDKEVLPYKVGGLLYMPAFQKNIVQKIAEKKLPHLNSAAFCLEDSIRDESLEDAETSLKFILQELEGLEDLPLVFVRIRSPRHLETFHEEIGSRSKILTGYILPKFDMSNAGEFIDLAKQINLPIMPTLESDRVASLLTRFISTRCSAARFKKVRDSIRFVRLPIIAL